MNESHTPKREKREGRREGKMIANTGLDLNVSSQFARHCQAERENYSIVNCQIVVKKDGRKWRRDKKKVSLEKNENFDLKFSVFRWGKLWPGGCANLVECIWLHSFIHPRTDSATLHSNWLEIINFSGVNFGKFSFFGVGQLIENQFVLLKI